MKRDAIKELFPDITDEQLDKLMDMNGADVNAAKSAGAAAEASLKEQLDRLQGELTAATAKAQESMTQEERLQAMVAEAERSQREFAVKSNRLDAMGIFQGAGLTAEQFSPMLDFVVSEDAERTSAAASAVAAMVKQQRESAVEQAKADLLKANPKPKGNPGGDGLTKEAFDKMTYSEQAKALSENPSLLDTFKK